MSYALATLTLGITLKQFPNLEEEHNKNGLGKLGFCSRHETDSQGPKSSHRHQKMLIEGITMHQTLNSFMQRLVADKQIGNEIDEQQLPNGKRPAVFNKRSSA